MQRKRKESILMMRMMNTESEVCKRNYFDYEVLHSEKSHISSLSRYAERRRSKGWRTIMKEAGLKLDNYFQAVEKTPIFMCGLISSEKKPLNRSTNEKYGGCLLDCNGQEIPRQRL